MIWNLIETAPKDGTEILLYAPLMYTEIGELKDIITIGFWAETFGGEEAGWDVPQFGEGFAHFESFTHWMPLPPKPEV